MVAERRVELHAAIEQRLVRNFEFLLEVLRALRPVQVVADQHHEVVLEALAEFDHLLGELVLRPVAGAEVPEDAKPERALLIRQGDRRFRRGLPGLDQCGHAAVAVSPLDHGKPDHGKPDHGKNEEQGTRQPLTRALGDLSHYLGSASWMKSAMT